MWIIFFVALLLLLAYQRASLIVYTITIVFYLLLVTLLSNIGMPALSIEWLIFLILAIPLNFAQLRRQTISWKLFSLYQKMKPSISATEKEALSIGTVGWEGELFSGMPNWEKFENYPAIQLTAEESAFLDNEVEQLCEMLDNWDINHNRFNLPEEVWAFLKDRGFFGLIIPKKYGGKGFSALAHSAIIVKIAGRSTAAATVVSVPNSLGPAELLLEYGTEEQKNHYLPRLALGEEIPCFALTGPEAGSDAGAIPDSGIVCMGRWKEGGEEKEVLGIHLQWDKRYITLAPVATLLGLAFKLYDPDHLIGERDEIGITCALIPTNLPGITIGRRHFPLNCAFPNGPTQGRDVFIPIDWIIGGKAMAGKGWQMLLECLSKGRSISLPSLATGDAKVSAFTTGAYARIRRQFKMAVGRFEGVEEALTRIAGHTYIIDATRLFAIAAVQRGEKPTIPSAISKYHTTELSRRVINDAMDVHGGKGICMGPHNYVAQIYEEAPIAITVEGANILTRCMIIFGQGVMQCHPYIFKEFIAAQNPDKRQALKQFDQLIFSHMGFIISNKVRAFLLGLSHGYLAKVPGRGVIKRYYRQLTRFSAAFAFMSDVMLLYFGAEFKRREHVSGRMADVISMLYMGSAVLSYFVNNASPEEDLPLVEWACQSILYQLETALDQIIRNLPSRFIAAALRIVIFPLGRCMHPPSDQLSNRVALLFSAPTPSRYRLANGAYLTPKDNNMVGIIDIALKQSIVAEEIEKKIHSAERGGAINGKNTKEKIAVALAAGIITEEEIHALQEADIWRKKMIAVDDFSKEELEQREKK